MLNVYLHQNTLGAIRLPDAQTSAAPYRDAVIEFIDLPLTGVCSVQEDAIEIEVFYRDELKTNSAPVRRGSIATGIKYNVDEDPTIFLYALALKLVCGWLDQQGVLDTCVKLDEKIEGVLIETADGDISARRVAGRERPDMACVTLLGTVDMCRPYMDEVLEENRRLQEMEKSQE